MRAPARNSPNLFYPTSESSSIQTVELIVKCHTILEMRNNDVSLHTFGSGLQFFKGPQKGVKNMFYLFSAKIGSK